MAQTTINNGATGLAVRTAINANFTELYARSYVLAQSAVALPNTGNTTENTLATITVPAGAMGASGRLEIMTLWSYTNNANTKNLRVRFGGAVFLGLTPTTTASEQALTHIANRTAGTQVSFTAANAFGLGNSTAAVTTGAIDTTAAVDITLTAQCAVGTDTITLESYSVRLVR